jgi:hypothetical protein
VLLGLCVPPVLRWFGRPNARLGFNGRRQLAGYDRPPHLDIFACVRDGIIRQTVLLPGLTQLKTKLTATDLIIWRHLATALLVWVTNAREKGIYSKCCMTAPGQVTSEKQGEQYQGDESS